MKRTMVVWIGLAALAGAGACKPKTSTEGTPAGTAPSATAAVAASPPAPKVGAAATPADAPFEGEIQLTLNEPSSKTPILIAYDVKGDKVRAQTVGADASAAHMVGDRKDKKVFEVVDATKSYASVDVDGKAPLPAVTKTGKTERVLGRECEDWTINDGGERFDMCVAKGVAYLDPAAGGGEPSWAAVLTRERAFPLRVVATDKSGKQEFRAEATRIDPKKLDDALFRVPNDYRTASLGKGVRMASIP